MTLAFVGREVDDLRLGALRELRRARTFAALRSGALRTAKLLDLALVLSERLGLALRRR